MLLIQGLFAQGKAACVFCRPAGALPPVGAVETISWMERVWNMKKKRMERLLYLLMCVVLVLSQVAIPAAYALGGDHNGRLVGTYENEKPAEGDGV